VHKNLLIVGTEEGSNNINVWDLTTLDIANKVQPTFLKEFGPRNPAYGLKVRVVDGKDVLYVGDHVSNITILSLEQEDMGERLDSFKTWRFHEPRVYSFAENEEGDLWFTNNHFVVSKVNS